MDLVVKELTEKILASDELRALVNDVAMFRTFDLRGIETPAVSAEQAQRARVDAVRLLCVGLFPDARVDDIQFAERVREVKNSTMRLLEEIPQGTLLDGRECSVFKFGDEVPTEPWEKYLVNTFQAVGALPLAQPYEATKRLLRGVVREGGPRVPANYVMALKAMESAGSLAGIPELDVEHRRVGDAMKFIEGLYDAEHRRARITFGDAGGGWMRAWGAAVKLAKCFDVHMPPKPSAAARDRSKRQA